jgi:GDP/UDP-N,N'-diacetylbacillosamine 2-epimerase (hydrolysing)
VIGNSSSGIIEAPSFKVPIVNIGDRQKGRIQAASTLNCSPEARAIRQTINHVLSPAFQESLSGITNPYDRPNTCSTIVDLLENTDLLGITKKNFHDVNFPTAENGFPRVNDI